jgi:hypothetical protein
MGVTYSSNFLFPNSILQQVFPPIFRIFQHQNLDIGSLDSLQTIKLNSKNWKTSKNEVW